MRDGAASPSAQFVTGTPPAAAARADGPGARPGGRGRGAGALGGFVLMLDDMTRDFEQEACAIACCSA
jgi:DNA polymerase-3 subunit epsilon